MQIPMIFIEIENCLKIKVKNVMATYRTNIVLFVMLQLCMYAIVPKFMY